jgi:hypothetical protein
MVIETVLGAIIVALVSGLIGKAISDRKQSKMENDLVEIRLVLARIETTLIDVPAMKEDLEKLKVEMGVVNSKLHI